MITLNTDEKRCDREMNVLDYLFGIVVEWAGIVDASLAPHAS